MLDFEDYMEAAEQNAMFDSVQRIILILPSAALMLFGFALGMFIGA